LWGEGATAADALEIAEELALDVMLLDIRLAGGGIEAPASIGRACPNLRTLTLTASEDEQDFAAPCRQAHATTF
jgi:DNA-binding NarL/FixJ family response regulator